MQERRTRKHCSTHIQPRSLSVTDTIQSFRNFIQMRILILNENGGISFFPKIVIQFSFGADDSFKRTESFQMRLSHIGNNTAIRLSNMNQRLDFTRMIGSHFNDSHLMFRFQAQQCQGHANMVIEISLCIEHIEFFFQYGRNQFLRCGFPVGTGYSHHASS